MSDMQHRNHKMSSDSKQGNSEKQRARYEIDKHAKQRWGKLDTDWSQSFLKYGFLYYKEINTKYVYKIPKVF